MVCGVLDLAYVFVVFGWQDGRAARVLRGIAVSLMGSGAISGGAPAAALGLAIHFGVACAAAALFYGLSRRFPALVSHPWIGGAAFGVGFYLRDEPRGAAAHPASAGAVPASGLAVGAGRARAVRRVADRLGDCSDDRRTGSERAAWLSESG